MTQKNVKRRFRYEGGDSVIEYRRIDSMDFVAAGVAPPVLGDGDRTEVRKQIDTRLRQDSEFQVEAMAKLIARAVLSHKVWSGHPADCPQGHVILSDLGVDTGDLLVSILRDSGLTEDAAQAASFRDPKRAGSADRGPGKEPGQVGVGSARTLGREVRT